MVSDRQNDGVRPAVRWCQTDRMMVLNRSYDRITPTERRCQTGSTMASDLLYDAVRTTEQWCPNDSTMIWKRQCDDVRMTVRQCQNDNTMMGCESVMVLERQYDSYSTAVQCWGDIMLMSYTVNGDSRIVTVQWWPEDGDSTIMTIRQYVGLSPSEAVFSQSYCLRENSLHLMEHCSLSIIKKIQYIKLTAIYSVNVRFVRSFFVRHFVLTVQLHYLTFIVTLSVCLMTLNVKCDIQWHFTWIKTCTEHSYCPFNFSSSFLFI
jgi:hypothetical protein